MKFNKQSLITENKCISQGVYSMWVEDEDMAKEARPGQFVSLYCYNASRLLPRPISICEISGNKLRFVYRTAGEGTKEISQMQAGTKIKALGPLGNGYTLTKGKSLLVAGGIGIPPMVALAKALKEQGNEVTCVLGYRDKDTFLTEELERYGTVIIVTEDGSLGVKGNVIDAMKMMELDFDQIYSCGPTPMLRALKVFALEKNIVTQLSLEERMACGIGACLACVCKTKEKDAHSHVNNTRVCTEGPVFYSTDVDL